MKIPAMLSIFVGALLLAYSGYCAYFTGSEVARLSLLPADKEVAHTLRLNPGMNPCRALVEVNNHVGWRASEMRNRSDKELEINLTMKDPEGEPQWEKLAVISRDSDEESRPGDKRSTQSLLVFEVPNDGEYSFVSMASVHQGNPNSMELVIKQKAKAAQPAVIAIGAILLVVGVVMLAIGRLAARSASWGA